MHMCMCTCACTCVCSMHIAHVHVHVHVHDTCASAKRVRRRAPAPGLSVCACLSVCLSPLACRIGVHNATSVKWSFTSFSSQPTWIQFCSHVFFSSRAGLAFYLTAMSLVRALALALSSCCCAARPLSAIVVGGSSGMGKAAAIAVASRGGSVLIASRSQANSTTRRTGHTARGTPSAAGCAPWCLDTRGEESERSDHALGRG